MEEHNHKITKENEKKILIAMIFTVIAMVAEIGYGYITNSMALLADGYHMGTHALALSLTYAAYLMIRRFADSPLFPNGTEKIGTLAGYTSSLFLGFTGVWIINEALQRLICPLDIKFDDAILVAIIGLIVNVVCIFIMEGNNVLKHHHDEDKKDYNFKAAYYHILADALTSILAIGALLAGKFCNLVCLDSIIGIVGGLLILKWAFGLIEHTVKILIDMKES